MTELKWEWDVCTFDHGKEIPLANGICYSEKEAKRESSKVCQQLANLTRRICGYSIRLYVPAEEIEK